MRLKKRQRVDAIRNDVRAPAKQWGKWLYLALVASFVFWLFDLFLGEMFYFRADGLVVRDRVVLATQYDASVVTLDVQEGEAVAGDTAVAMLRSQAVEQTIAELSARIATMLEQASRLEVRRKVIEATRGLVNGRVEVARSARREVEERAMYFTQRDRMQRLKDELESLQTRSTDEAEYAVIQSDLPKLRSAIENAQSALRRLEETYAGGVVRVPVDGVVGHLHVSQGSVVTKTTPLMEVYAGAPYVLAYVPEGAIYSLAAGDPVTVHVGFSSYDGEVEAIYPVTATLPDEYIDALRVPRRAPLARIRFTGADGLPSLFAQTEVMASGWPPRWFLRLFGATWSDTPQRRRRLTFHPWRSPRGRRQGDGSHPRCIPRFRFVRRSTTLR
ncbi:MAG: HlyD family efflux transporter periplasmic adaptor subunit [Pseudomonadales bacterium]